jgi:pimeloyl-ACP methyl ester carboxylesterase
MTTFVLVPAGGHGGWSFQPVAGLLRSQRHTVHPLTLTGLGDRAHLLNADIDLETHIRDVARTLLYEDLHDVVLVGHGYGGMVITGVADRIPARIGHLVYMDAAVPVHGQSLSDLAPGPIELVRREMVEIAGVQQCLFPAGELMLLWGVTDATLLKWMLDRLTPHPWKCFEQPLLLKNQRAVGQIPQSHINSTMWTGCRDSENLRDIAEGRLWQRDTAHELILTEPHWVADKLAATAEWLPAPQGRR